MFVLQEVTETKENLKEKETKYHEDMNMKTHHPIRSENKYRFYPNKSSNNHIKTDIRSNPLIVFSNKSLIFTTTNHHKSKSTKTHKRYQRKNQIQ